MQAEGLVRAAIRTLVDNMSFPPPEHRSNLAACAEDVASLVALLPISIGARLVSALPMHVGAQVLHYMMLAGSWVPNLWLEQAGWLARVLRYLEDRVADVMLDDVIGHVVQQLCRDDAQQLLAGVLDAGIGVCTLARLCVTCPQQVYESEAMLRLWREQYVQCLREAQDRENSTEMFLNLAEPCLPEVRLRVSSHACTRTKHPACVHRVSRAGCLLCIHACAHEYVNHVNLAFLHLRVYASIRTCAYRRWWPTCPKSLHVPIL
jgi:hypothetical protein